jgi:uncharacterized membrane protein HdeD (DUF308 family)
MQATRSPYQVENVPWWLVLIQGIATILIGILLLISPGMTTLILIQFLGIYWLVDGIFSLIRIFIKDSDIAWGWLLVRGILGILAGLVVIQHPLWSTLLIPTFLIIVLAIQGIIGGVIGLFQAFKGGGWGAGILGVLNIVFGIILFASPLLAATILPLVVGIFALLGGILAIIISFRLRSA